MRRPSIRHLSPPPADDAEPMRLSQLADRIATAIRAGVPGPVWVVAEIGEMRTTARGHLCLTLVERQNDQELARITAWMWKSSLAMVAGFEQATGQRLQKGLELLLQAEVRFEPVWGLSLTVREIDATYTLGALARMRRETLERLEAEGLIDLNKALQFPAVPQRVAVVSSAQAAGYGDFVHQLEHNVYGYRFALRLFPTLVQGDLAPAALAEAIGRASALESTFDVVVLLRGGGSELDLVCFDAYEVAAAIAACPLPVVTGIGHERDATIADRVAHTRAKTPTAAAELLLEACRSFESRLAELGDTVVATVRGEVADRQQGLSELAGDLDAAAHDALSAARLLLENTAHRFARPAQVLQASRSEQLAALLEQLKALPRALLERRAGDLAAAGRLLDIRARHHLERATGRVDNLADRTRLLDPVRVLERGYSLTYLGGRLVKDAVDVEPGARITTRLRRGTIESTVERTEA